MFNAGGEKKATISIFLIGAPCRVPRRAFGPSHLRDRACWPEILAKCLYEEILLLIGLAQLHPQFCGLLWRKGTPALSEKEAKTSNSSIVVPSLGKDLAQCLMYVKHTRVNGQGHLVARNCFLIALFQEVRLPF